MKVSEAFPSKYLKADDLTGKTAVTITDVLMEPVGIDKSEKLVAYFRELTKPMVVNRTNADMIESLYGSEMDAWKGQRIVLVRVIVPFQGKHVPAIRVSDSAPGAKPAVLVPEEPPLPDNMPEEMPF